jgi:hypothetical protein
LWPSATTSSGSSSRASATTCWAGEESGREGMGAGAAAAAPLALTFPTAGTACAHPANPQI